MDGSKTWMAATSDDKRGHDEVRQRESSVEIGIPKQIPMR